MSGRWKVAEAKARLSEVLGNAQRAPQVIENRGTPVAIVLSIQEFQALEQDRAALEPQRRLHEFLRFSEAVRNEGGAELELPSRKARGTPFSDEEAY